MSSADLAIPQRFLRSTLASYWSLAVRLAVSLAARMILARLLIPEAHGLYELALRIVTVAGAVRDLGLPYHLMRDERRPYGTVLAFGVASGIVVTAGLILAAPLVAGLHPDLPRVLSVFAFWVLLDGLAVVPRTFFERELAIGRLVAPEIGRGLTVAGLAVALAGYGWGVWSLVAADLAAAGLFAALVWRRAWSRIPLRVEARLIPELLTRSHLLFLIWVTFQCVTYVDAFIVASFADAATVGQYARAYMLAFLMRQIVFPRALLPALVEVRHDPPRFAAAFRLATVFLLFFEVTAGYLLFFNAEMVVAVVLGRQWGPAVALLRILCFVPFLDAFSELGGEVLKVRHEDRLWLAIMLVNLASLVAFGVLFTRRWGAAGMAAANLLLLGNLGMAWRMSRIFAGGFARLLGDMALIYLVPLPLFLAAAVALPAPGWPRLAASVAAALAGGGVLALRFRRPLLDFLQSQARSGHDPVGEASPGA